MLTLALGILAALAFLLAALDASIGTFDLLLLGLAFWSGAWTASHRDL